MKFSEFTRETFDKWSFGFAMEIECVGFRDTNFNLMKNDFADRYQLVKIHGKKSEYKIISCGVPHDSVRGLLIFLVNPQKLVIVLQRSEDCFVCTRYHVFPC